MVQLFQVTEHTGVWPEPLLEIPIACLRKPTGDTPLDIRPISLASVLYRIWARLRWQEIRDWHELWLPPELKGGARHREAIDAYFQVMLEVENNNASNHPLVGIPYDYEKCNDHVAWPIEQGLLENLGLPHCVLKPMYAFSAQIRRRFKIGNSLGPCFSNTNSIMQGCPLAILRINSLIAAWARVIRNSSDTATCSVSAFIDDKNMRASSIAELKTGIRLTELFDIAVDAVVNLRKTVLYATQTKLRTELLHDNELAFQLVQDDKLLGGQMSFSKKRSTMLATVRASKYIRVAERIALAPLNIRAKEILLQSAGASKFTFGLELGSCSIHAERRLRSAVANALWAKRRIRSLDMLFSLCHKGHHIDPFQLRSIWPFRIARRQLMKHEELRDLWIQTWALTEPSRSQMTPRSQLPGILANLQRAANQIGWEWISPIEFRFKINEQNRLLIHLLHYADPYFAHLIRFGISLTMWKRASNRKALRGIQVGVDKTSTLSLLRSTKLAEFDRGILRSFLADAVCTQVQLFNTKVAEHPMCPFCWTQQETLDHLFWTCPKWQQIRSCYLTPTQLSAAADFPPCARKCGIFNQIAAIVTAHERGGTAGELVHTAHSCDFPEQIQRCMIEIVKARNITSPS